MLELCGKLSTVTHTESWQFSDETCIKCVHDFDGDVWTVNGTEVEPNKLLVLVGAIYKTGELANSYMLDHLAHEISKNTSAPLTNVALHDFYARLQKERTRTALFEWLRKQNTGDD